MNRRLTTFFQDFWGSDSPEGVAGLMAALLLTPLSWVYSMVQTIRRTLYRRGILHSNRLPARVISIGGIRAGGSGKTPFTCWLAQRLRGRGYRVAVLTRGYGRKGADRTIILAGGSDDRPDPLRVGDEPCLLAAALDDVPVVVDAKRSRGARQALDRFPVDIFLMDDGFQHLHLYRDVDIVLLPEGEEPARQGCMPRGPLREPATALRDSDMLIRVVSGTVGPGREAFGRPGPGSEVRDGSQLSFVMEPGNLRTLDGNLKVDPGALAGEKLFAFCGIARPAVFRKSLEEKGLKIQEHRDYPDHHRYTARDHRELMERMRGVHRAVTTAKDAVKLKRFPWPPGKLLVLDIRPALSDEPLFWKRLESMLHTGHGTVSP